MDNFTYIPEPTTILLWITISSGTRATESCSLPVGVLMCGSASMATIAAKPTPAAVLVDVGFVHMNGRPSDDLVAAMPDVIFSYPVSSPLITTGLSGRSLDILMSGLSSHGTSAKLITDVLDMGIQPAIRGLSSLGLTLLPLAGTGIGAAADPATLIAGGSVGVALASGDMSAGSLGTITYRDGDTLIGYGHPFISNGSSQFPLTSVSIIDTMKSFEASFKLGTLGDPIGTILEDRMAAIGGRLGPVADLIDLSLDVEDTDRKTKNTYSIGLVKERRLVPELLLAMGYQAIDTALDRIGQGTVEDTAPAIEFEQLPFDHPLYILYSSGTTGVPKSRVAINDFRTDYELFSKTLPDEYFPPGANWLMLGPSGPRRVRSSTRAAR